MKTWTQDPSSVLCIVYDEGIMNQSICANTIIYTYHRFDLLYKPNPLEVSKCFLAAPQVLFSTLALFFGNY